MKKCFLFVLVSFVVSTTFAQGTDLNMLQLKKDSALRAMMRTDSLKIEKEYAESAHWENLKSIAQYPLIRAGDFSGVIPVKDPTEIPDPTMDYKLLFELTYNNPDSNSVNINYGLVEVARVINLHALAGIPAKKIVPVIVVHAGALNAFRTDTSYQMRFKNENPNLKVIHDLEKLGARFIACGQAMNFLKFKKEDLLPGVKVSLTAQTVLSSYQLKGYVLYDIGDPNK